MPEFNSMVPFGFRFAPTDEELIAGFLWAKVMGDELPWNGIAEKELYGKNFPREPWEVFRDLDESPMYWNAKKREGSVTKNTIYAFTTLPRAPKKKRVSRRAGCGKWVCQTGPKKIKNSDTGEIIGNSKTLAFEHPGSDADVGHWTMHEYSLSHKMVRLSGKANAANLVLCKITKTIKKKESGGKCAQHLQFFPPAAIGYGGDFLDVSAAQKEMFYPAIGDGGGCVDVSIAQPELFYPEIGGGGDSTDISVAQPDWFHPDIGDGGGSIDVPELFSPAISQGRGSIDVWFTQPELFYREIGVGGNSIEQLCYLAIGEGCGSIDIRVPATVTASNKRAAEEEHPDEELGGGFKRQKTSCGDGDGEGFPDAATEGFLPLGFDDNVDAEGLFRADFSLMF